jgi:hypothetical protein
MAAVSTFRPGTASHPTSDGAWLAPLDAARSAVLRALGSPGRRFLGDREARVALYGSFGVLVALAMTALAPAWLLAIGPFVMGIPHLFADTRYLVVRQGLHRRRGFWLLVLLPLVLAFFQPQATTALAAIVGATLLARGSYLRRSLVLAPVLGLAIVAASAGHRADIVMAHLHNLVALAFWWAWAPASRTAGRGGLRWIPIALFAIASALLLGGAFDASAYPSARAVDVSLRDLVGTLSLIRDPRLGLRFVLFFAFAQSVHYAVWVRLVPEEDRPRPGLRSFQSTLAALVQDFGRIPLVVSALAVVGLVAWGCLDVHAARVGYLRVALFHGPLELAVAALLFIERRRLKTA